eukprot:275485_1
MAHCVDDSEQIELKQSEFNEGGNPTAMMTANGYNEFASQHRPHTSYRYQQPSQNKMYCVAIHQVLLHLILIYCTTLVTYVAFFQTNNNNCSCLNKSTLSPTTMNTQHHSEYPTNKPSLQPIIDHSIYENFIGDFKISAQNTSHENWILCDGSLIDSTEYPQLFNVIGYSFGSFSEYPSLFRLPNATDHVVGINGHSYTMGKMIGNKEISLTENNLPSHSHYLLNSGNCATATTTSYSYLSATCFPNNWDNYRLGSSNNIPNTLKSGTVGSGTAINIMQPTVFVGNLFIYA